MPPTQKDIVYINYFDAIDMDRARMLMGVCTQLLGQFKPKKIYFMFATPGGEVPAGIALYNFLKSLPVQIVMHNMGAVNSIGNVIFLAGDERYACTGATFLFHGVEVGVKKDSSFNLSKLKEIKSSLEEDENKIAGIVASQSSLTDEEIRKMFSTGESKSANWAKEKGLITDIRLVPITSEDALFNVAVQAQS